MGPFNVTRGFLYNTSPCSSIELDTHELDYQPRYTLLRHMSDFFSSANHLFKSIYSSFTRHAGREIVPTTDFESSPSEAGLIGPPSWPEQSQSLYSSVAKCETSLDHEPRIQQRRYAVVKQCLKVFCQTLVIGFAIWGCFSLLIPPTTLSASISQRVDGECDCGDSIMEAKLKGCEWDELASAWLPAKCRDDELTSDFARRGPNGAWEYYADDKGTTTLNHTEVSLLADQLDNAYWVTLSWHLLHCVFYWKKTYRARFTNRDVELRFDNILHIQHCEEIFLNWGIMSAETLLVQHAQLRSDNWPPESA